VVSWLPDIYAEVAYEAASNAVPGFRYMGRFLRTYRLYLASKKRDE
jgi:hypothetical protein